MAVDALVQGLGRRVPHSSRSSLDVSAGIQGAAGGGWTVVLSPVV